MKALIAGCYWILAFCSTAQTAQDDFSLNEPRTSNLIPLSLWSTYYYIHEFHSGGNIPIVFENGEVSGLFADTCDFCTASLEGTAYVRDTSGNITVINFAQTGDSSRVDCRRCTQFSGSKLKVENWGKTLWKKSVGFGDGVKNYRLVPFRTIAVDKNRIPYGTVIYIPMVRGKTILLPNGSKVIHDGYFFAGDTGGAIKNNHVDVFTGIFAENPFPGVIKSRENQVFEAFVINDAAIIDKLNRLHQK